MLTPRTVPNPRVPTLPHQRFLKHLAVKALCWVSVKAIFRLGFLTNRDPRYSHLNKHVWQAAKGASELECQTGTCWIDGEVIG